MKKSQVFIGLVALTLIFTLGSNLATAQPAQTRPGMRGFFAEKFLDLTPEQKAKLEELRKARQEERTAFAEKMQKLRADLRELMKDPQANEKKIHGLIDEMFQMRATQMKSSIRHRQEVEKVFTPEQLEKMKDLRARMTAFRRGRMSAFGPGPGWGSGWGRRPGWRSPGFSRPFWPRWRW